MTHIASQYVHRCWNKPLAACRLNISASTAHAYIVYTFGAAIKTAIIKSANEILNLMKSMYATHKLR